MSDHASDKALRGALRPAGPVKLTLTECHRSDATIIGVRGELDLLTAPRVGALVDEVVRRRSGTVVVDLRETDFLDSAGLYVLLNARRRLSRRSREMAVVCADGPVRRLLELSRLTEALGVVSSLEEAV